MDLTRHLSILTVLGQRPGFTGSGVLVSELWKCGMDGGDKHHLICAGYPKDDLRKQFGQHYSLITFSLGEQTGELSFSIPGMSDVMPYESTRYAELSDNEIGEYVNAYERYVKKAVTDLSPDLIHINHLWVLTALGNVVRKIPCVVTVHGTELKLLKTAPRCRDIVTKNIGLIRGFFCVSRDIANDVCREYSIPEDKVTILGNGYNDSIFKLEGCVKNINRAIVLCAGKFVEWKGFRYIIRASGLVRKPHTLVILGTGPKSVRDSLVNEAKRCGANVLFPGHLLQEEVSTWMRSAEVFVLPSIHEPFGLVLLEAMACGCPSIASASGGPKDIISAQLLSLGLARLVTPLRSNEKEEENRYVGEFARALEDQLSKATAPNFRKIIASSVNRMTWRDVYQRMRERYCQILDD